MDKSVANCIDSCIEAFDEFIYKNRFNYFDEYFIFYRL